MAPDEGLQRMIAAALTDEGVLAALLSRPISLAHRFHLTVPERRFLAGIRARDLQHFAALVEAWKAGRMPAGYPWAGSAKTHPAPGRLLIYAGYADPAGNHILLSGPTGAELPPIPDATIAGPGSIVALMPGAFEPLWPSGQLHLPADGDRRIRAGRIVVLRQVGVPLDGQP